MELVLCKNFFIYSLIIMSLPDSQTSLNGATPAQNSIFSAHPAVVVANNQIKIDIQQKLKNKFAEIKECCESCEKKLNLATKTAYLAAVASYTAAAAFYTNINNTDAAATSFAFSTPE